MNYLNPLAPPHHIQNPRDIHSSILKDDIATLSTNTPRKDQPMGSPSQQLVEATKLQELEAERNPIKTTLDDQVETNNQNNKLHPSKRTCQFKTKTLEVEDVSLNENRDSPFTGG